jgi:hypothetical protein
MTKIILQSFYLQASASRNEQPMLFEGDLRKFLSMGHVFTLVYVVMCVILLFGYKGLFPPLCFKFVF